MAAVAERGDGGDLGAPADGSGGQRVEEQVAQGGAVDLGPAALGVVGVVDGGVPVQDAGGLAARLHQAAELLVQPGLAQGALGGVLVQVEHAALRAGVAGGVEVEDGAADAVQGQDPGKGEPAESGADDEEGVVFGDGRGGRGLTCGYGCGRGGHGSSWGDVRGREGVGAGGARCGVGRDGRPLQTLTTPRLRGSGDSVRWRCRSRRERWTPHRFAYGTRAAAYGSGPAAGHGSPPSPLHRNEHVRCEQVQRERVRHSRRLSPGSRPGPAVRTPESPPAPPREKRRPGARATLHRPTPPTGFTS